MTATSQPQVTTETPTPVSIPAVSREGFAQLLGRLVEQHPTEQARIVRGVEVLSHKRILEDADFSYLVESSVAGQFYRANTARCTCPDSLQRGSRCKHQWCLTILVAMSVTARHERLAAQFEPIPYTLTAKALAVLDAPEPVPAA
jgi:hypothetical protein